MKKTLSLALFLLISNLVFAQEIVLQGVVRNLKSDEPISYAAISVYNELKGISSDVDGNFKLTLSSEYSNKKLAISAIGYSDTIVKISSFVDNDNVIKLVPKQYEILEAVVIAENREIIVDKLKKSFFNQVSTFGSSDPRINLKFFNYEEEYEQMFIEEIGFFFDRYYDSDIEPRFILRIMEVDSVTGYPGSDLLEKTVVRLAKTKPRDNVEFEYKLEKPILFPKQGVFVGIEWLAIEENKVKGPYDRTFYAPTLKSKSRKRIEPNIWEYYGGVWKLRKPYGGKHVEPYIQLKLTN
ncbi:MAG TPA: carboxypeptidase-like regulatory domain-containing protein [Bacteroidales bacterium]|nr:carboxypeptidase-like regulatory domain-containing protein [Bacteroidales bacterium]